jgi:hypothetical protein
MQRHVEALLNRIYFWISGSLQLPCGWQKLHPARKHWACKPWIFYRMIRWLNIVLRLLVAGLKSRRNLLLENLALRHQLLVLSRGSNRPPGEGAFCPFTRPLLADCSERV